MSNQGRSQPFRTRIVEHHALVETPRLAPPHSFEAGKGRGPVHCCIECRPGTAKSVCSGLLPPPERPAEGPNQLNLGRMASWLRRPPSTCDLCQAAPKRWLAKAVRPTQRGPEREPVVGEEFPDPSPNKALTHLHAHQGNPAN